MIRRRWFKALLGVASAALLVTASGSATHAQRSGRGSEGILHLYYWQAPTILNPHLSPGSKDLSASRITYEPLATVDRRGRLIPILAAEIPSLENGEVARNGRSVTWKLKKGVRWSDGKPFTADDVKFTFDYVTNPAVGSSSAANYASVARVVVIDPLTVKVVFKNVNPAWATPFVGAQGCILPKHVFAPYNGANAAAAPANLKPVGTGPYRVVEFSKQDVILVGGVPVATTLTRFETNPYYRDKTKPAFSGIALEGGGGDAVTAAKIISGGLADFAWNVQVSDAVAQSVRDSGRGRVVRPLGSFVERIMFNFTDPNRATPDGERSSIRYPNPILSDKRVREAITLAIDRKSIAALYGHSGVATGDIVAAPPQYRSRHAPSPFNLQKAASLLAAAGWTDHNGDGIRDKGGIPLRLTYQTSVNPVRQGAQQIVQKALQSIGVKVDLKSIDSSTFFGPVEGTTSTRYQFYADLEEFAYNNKVPDPGVYLDAWSCAQRAQQANDWSLSNWSRYCNKGYDALYAHMATEINPQKRTRLILALNDYLLDDYAVVPLVRQEDVSAVSGTLAGFQPTPWDLEVWNIADWHRRK